MEEKLLLLFVVLFCWKTEVGGLLLFFGVSNELKVVFGAGFDKLAAICWCRVGAVEFCCCGGLFELLHSVSSVSYAVPLVVSYE